MPVQSQPPAAPAPARSTGRRRPSAPLAQQLGEGRRRPGTPAPSASLRQRHARTPSSAPLLARGDGSASGDQGDSALVVFVAAILLVVAAVVVAGAVDRLWVLVPAMVVDFAVTFGVVLTINRLLGDDGEPPA